jgi:hypothetical protein
VWLEKGIPHKDVAVDLGYRSDPEAGVTLEPVAKIVQNGTPVADAMVFNVLVAVDGGDVIGEEMATVYESLSGSNAAIYAQGTLHPPAGAAQCTVRFRIVLPDSQEAWTRDVMIPLKVGR